VRHYSARGSATPNCRAVAGFCATTEIEDERRAAEAKQRSEAALGDAIWESGLNTFATKKCGEDWYMTHDYYDIAEEYAEWLERRREPRLGLLNAPRFIASAGGGVDTAR
jgi:hypothetical protein